MHRWESAETEFLQWDAWYVWTNCSCQPVNWLLKRSSNLKKWSALKLFVISTNETDYEWMSFIWTLDLIQVLIQARDDHLKLLIDLICWVFCWLIIWFIKCEKVQFKEKSSNSLLSKYFLNIFQCAVISDEDEQRVVTLEKLNIREWYVVGFF